MIAKRRRLVLASASPRRMALLARLGIDAVQRPAAVDEVGPTEVADPVAAAAENARRKAAAVAATSGDDDVVLAADTVLVVDDGWLGKPASRPAAHAMLASLAGKTHRVATAVAIVANEGRRECVETTRVAMRPLDRRAIEAYHAAVDPLDKAGAYNIDEPGPLDGGVVADIDGSYANVMGLPIERIEPWLVELGVIDGVDRSAGR